MNPQNNSFNNLNSSTDNVSIEIEGSADAGTITSTSSSSSYLAIPKTARDKFFKDLQYDKEKNRWSAECSLCPKSKRTFDKLGVTSNFTRHARECHKEAFDIWTRELNESKSMFSSKPINKITNHFPKTSDEPQHSKYNINHPRQVELSTSITNDLIIKLGLPISIVERPAFINFMKIVDPKFSLTSRRTLSRTTIPFLYEKMRNQLQTFCSTATFLSLALDVWSDRRLRSFFAVTAHAIVDGNFKSYVLDFVPLWGSHCGSLLLETYEAIVNTFDIKDKVIRLVTDSSSNNISAFKDIIIPGFEQYFMEDIDDETLDEDSDNGTLGEDSDIDIIDEYDNTEHISSTTNSTTIESTQEEIQNSFRNLLEYNQVFRIPCFAHTVQLVVKDGLKATEKILSSLEKVSAIAKLSHTSTKFAEKLELINVSIPRAIKTRWNSQFLTIERVLAIPVLKLNEILIQLKYKHLCLTTHDVDVLNEFICLLSLLADVTTKTQQQNSPSISLIAPSILAIYFDLKNEQSNVHYTTTLCDTLLASLLSRFGGLLEQLEIDVYKAGVAFEKNKHFYDLYKDPLFIFAPFLDGMFKLDWINKSFLNGSTKERLCKKIKQLIVEQGVVIERANRDCVLVNPDVIEQSQPSGDQASNSPGLKRKTLFSNIQHDQQHAKKKSICEYKLIKEEIERYLNNDEYDSMILIRSTTSSLYKTLSKLAIKYLCVPATSAAVERTFSQSGFLLRSHRARMSRKTLQQLTLLKCNSEI